MRVQVPKLWISALRMNGNLASDTIDMVHSDMLAMQLSWTGSGAAGTLALQGSVDGTNFVAYAATQGGTAITQAVSGAGSIIWHLSNVEVPYLRVIFTNSAGDGYLTVWYNTKSTGGK